MILYKIPLEDSSCCVGGLRKREISRISIGTIVRLYRKGARSGTTLLETILEDENYLFGYYVDTVASHRFLTRYGLSPQTFHTVLYALTSEEGYVWYKLKNKRYARYRTPVSTMLSERTYDRNL